MWTIRHGGGGVVSSNGQNSYTLFTLKEHQRFLPKTEISVTSDTGFTMEVYGFQIWKCGAPTGDIGKLILVLKNVY